MRDALLFSNKVMSFRDLKIWHMGIQLVQTIYKITEDLPKTETYGLISQMQRSAVSIPSNIAEGFRRKHTKEYKRFLGISLGSSGELETQVEIARNLGYIDEKTYLDLIEQLDHLCRMIQRLMAKLVFPSSATRTPHPASR